MSENARKYKNNAKSVAELRTRRQETSIELRKTKKDDQIFKRRNIDINALATSPLKESNAQLSPTETMTLSEILTHMNGNDESMILEATRSARKMLSQERNPPIDTLINHGIVPLCVQFLDRFHK